MRKASAALAVAAFALSSCALGPPAPGGFVFGVMGDTPYLEGGPADRSYGIHVAHLAGIPRDVVRAARKHLAELERQLRPASSQPDLFAAGAGTPEPQAQEPHPAIDALDDLDPDALSPKEALEALYRLKKLLD